MCSHAACIIQGVACSGNRDTRITKAYRILRQCCLAPIGHVVIPIQCAGVLPKAGVRIGRSAA